MDIGRATPASVQLKVRTKAHEGAIRTHLYLVWLHLSASLPSFTVFNRRFPWFVLDMFVILCLMLIVLCMVL